MSKSLKYIDLISETAQDQEQESLQFHADDAVIHVQASILASRKAISSAKRALNNARKAMPYSLKDEVDATVALESLNSGLELSLKILKEKF